MLHLMDVLVAASFYEMMMMMISSEGVGFLLPEI